MYSLFVDTLSVPAFIGIFDEQNNIIWKKEWDARHAESDTLMESIESLLHTYTMSYKDIEKILCIVWPWSFTGVRVTTLVVNTIAFSFGMDLYPITIDQFFRYQNAPLPWIIPLTKNEVLFWSERDQQNPTITSLKDIDSSQPFSSITSQFSWIENVRCFHAHDHQNFLQNFTIKEKVQLLFPLYARDPNILLQKNK